VVLEAALEEIAAVGTGRMSMREIAKRAGVSHAAPAHHFGDKAGIFTAIAVQGFELLHDETAVFLGQPDALLRGGIAYINFGITHPSHFEVMFRPDLYRADDPELAAVRDRSYEVLHEAVRQGLGPGREDEVLANSAVAWSVVHGFVTLWLYGNLQPKLGEDATVEGLTPAMSRAFVTLGEAIARQLPPGA